MVTKIHIFKTQNLDNLLGLIPGKNPLGSGIVGGGTNSGSGAAVFESACPNEAK
jgi:hypothetical protein